MIVAPLGRSTLAQTGRDHWSEVDCPPADRVAASLVEGLAGELGGDVRWRSGPNGVTAMLSFPLGLELSATLGA